MVKRNSQYTSEYQSPNSVGKRQTVPIDANDPRLRWDKIGQTKARLGAELDIVDFSGKALTASLTGLSITNLVVQEQVANLNVSSSTSSIADKLTSSSIYPSDISNLAASWVGTTLRITWNFDTTLLENKYFTNFSIKFTISGIDYIIKSFVVNTTGTSQSYDFTLTANESMFGFFQTSFDLVSVAPEDSFNNIGNYASIVPPVYKNSLPAPIITVTSMNEGYTVAWTPITDITLNYISIEEYISADNVNIPTGNYKQVYLDSVNPAVVLTSTTEGRWVKARFTDKAGTYGEYCTAVYITPTATVAVNTTPPNAVTYVSAVWSGNDIVISYTLPSTLAGSYFQVTLTPFTGINGYFYVYPDGTSNLNQTTIIRKADIFAQFGRYYSSFSSALFTSFSSIGIKDPNGVAFSVDQRTNPFVINGVRLVPTFTLTGIVNGYSATFNLPSYATYAEVYQKYTSWSGITVPNDAFTGTYSSGGSSGTATITLTNIKDNDGVALSPIPTGYIITGTGIPNNTYIASVSGNTITLSNNLTTQASGTYSAQGLVYSGIGPANIPSTLYQNTYIIVRYYDDFDNSSAISAEQIVIPYQPTTVDVVGPPNVLSTGLSTTSGIDLSGTLGFNGYINLSWAAVTDSQLRGYRIRFTTDAVSPVYSYVDYPIDQSNPPTGTLSYKLTGLAVGATYKIAVATYDQYNNLSTGFTSFTDATITGSPAISNYISAGNFQFGQGVDPDNATGITGTKRGLYFNSSNYWFLNSSNSARLKVGGSTSNYLLWDGSNFTIDGNISARGGSFQGNVALTASGASIYSGDVTTSAGNLTGDGFILNSGGLLIRKGTNQVSLDTTTGGINANYGSIAGWDITSAKIEKLASTKYAGLSPSGTYAFWAGSTVSGGDTTQFAVDRTGKVYATSMQISGGALDIGATSSNLTSGFHVTAAGKMYADGAQITGTLSVTGDSTFKSNIQLWTDNTTYGSIYGGASPTSGVRTVMNYKGFAAYSSNAAVTEILTTPITDTQTTPGGNTISMPSDYVGINFFTKGAIIGGWIVNDGVITSDKSKQITLTSGTNAGIVMSGIVGVNTNYTVGMSVPSAAGDKVFWAGASKSAANFYVDTTGTMNATGAVISSKGSLTTGNSYVKIDGAADNLTIYGLATNHPGASQTFTATITGGAIQSAYSATVADVITKTTTTLNSGNISTDGFMSIVASKGFQVFDGGTTTANTAPMISITPAGSYTTFKETRDGVLNTYNGSAFVSNASVSFLNSGSVILGSGSGLSGGTSDGNTSYVYVNGYARVRNSTPVGTGTGSYIRNTYISSVPPSPTGGGGFVGDLWVSTT
jgi:hypothetical protein